MSTDALLQRVSQLTASLTGRPEDVLPVCALLEELLRMRPGVRGTQLQALIRSALPLVDRQVSEALRDVARAQQAFEANPMSPAYDAARFVNSATLALRSLSAPAPVAASAPVSTSPAAAAPSDVEAATGEDRRMLFLVLLVAFALVTAVIAAVALLTLPDDPSPRNVSRGVVVEPEDSPVADPPAAPAAATEASAPAVSRPTEPSPPVTTSAPALAQEPAPVRPTLHMRGEIVLRGSGDPKAVAAELRQALGLPPQPNEAAAASEAATP